MKPLLLVYATREKYTKRVAEHIADSLSRRGIIVELGNAAHLSADLELGSNFQAVIVAASVHGGRHEHEIVAFVKRHRAALEQLPNAFVSVSLSEAAAHAPNASETQRQRAAAKVEVALARFRHDTGWTPSATLPVAGALQYRRYRLPLRFVMRSLARWTGLSTDTSRDHAWTDWAAVDTFVGGFVDRLGSKPTAA